MGSECEDCRDERGREREGECRAKPCSVEQDHWKRAASHCCRLYLFCVLPHGTSMRTEVKGMSKGPG